MYVKLSVCKRTHDTGENPKVGQRLALCKQYKYNADVDGWLKVHKAPLTWLEAFMKCHLEDAVLASPSTAELRTAMLNAVEESGIDFPIYIGIKELFVYGHYTSIEGVQLEDMPVKFPSTNGTKPKECMSMTRDRAVTFNSCDQWWPYICYKKNSTQLKYNFDCGTFDPAYHYNSVTGSCYKLHKQARTWKGANKVCVAEGGHLVIINDQKEADVVVNLLKEKLPQKNDSFDLLSHTGFYNWNSDLLTFLTIHGEKMDTVYNNWDNNKHYNKGVHLYGGILGSGRLDIGTTAREAYFVCEKDPNIQLFDQQERILRKIY
ncbi:hypothetical protein SFRURICE_007040 [Spodoptera frugiperda]|nr:hypothetical protein SFRURICE_007040 [Spodoptera frugiperda]